MQRFSTNEERELQLAEWEAHLNEREADLEKSIRAFRDLIDAQAKKVVQMQDDVAQREVELKQRVAEVEAREKKLLELMARYAESLATDSSSKRNDAPPPLASGTSAARPHIPRGVSPSKYAEGIVEDLDPAAVPSYVEELSDSQEDSEDPFRRPRGLQGAANFQPLAPDDSGMYYLRKRQNSVVTLEGEDSMLQDQFDDAVEFLIAHGVFTEEQVVEMMNRGASAQEILELFAEEMSNRQRGGRGADDSNGKMHNGDDTTSGDDPTDPDVEADHSRHQTADAARPRYSAFDDDSSSVEEEDNF